MTRTRKLLVFVIALALSGSFVFLTAIAGPPLGEIGPNPRSYWVGTYEGRVDGRRARLEVSVKHVSQEQLATYNIVLEDLERGVRFTGEGWLYYSKPKTRHIMRIRQPLTSKNGTQKDVQRLLLHTWDVDYVSGHSTWNGRDFGLLFERVSE